MNEIIFDIVAEKCSDLVGTMKNIRTAMDKIEENFNVEIELHMVIPNIEDYDNSRITTKCRLDLSHIFEQIPNIFVITQLFVPDELRKNGIGTNILYSLNDTVGIDSLILVNAGILYSEYPMDRYTLSGEKGKINLDADEVVNQQVKFWTERNFANITRFFLHANYQVIFCYTNPIGAIFQQFIIDYTVTNKHMVHNTIEEFYYIAFKMIKSFKSDKDVFLFPFIYSLSDYIEKVDYLLGPLKDRTIPITYGSKSELMSEPWHSSFNVNHEQKDRTTLSIMAYNYRLVLCQLGGAELYIKDASEIININNSMVFFDKERFIDDAESGNTFITDKESAIVFNGYGLLTDDNIWIYGKWYYDPKNNYIHYDSNDFNRPIDCIPEILVGEIEGIVL